MYGIQSSDSESFLKNQAGSAKCNVRVIFLWTLSSTEMHMNFSAAIAWKRAVFFFHFAIFGFSAL